MWIKLKALMAGPDGIIPPGSIIDHPDGERLVATGQAERAKAPTRVAAPAEPPVSPQAEAAEAPAAGRETGISAQAGKREKRGVKTGNRAGK